MMIVEVVQLNGEKTTFPNVNCYFIHENTRLLEISNDIIRAYINLDEIKAFSVERNDKE